MIAEAKGDYSLIGRCAQQAVDEGLAAAEWYHTDVPRRRMKDLMRRKDGPAIRDTVIWIALLAGFAFGGCWSWGTWWCVPFFVCYGVLYGSACDARWHEAGHGTPFRTVWMNDVLYQVASFMSMKEPTYWRWSHARHHTDTMIVGRDREFAAMRPPDVLRMLLNLLAIREVIGVAISVARHSTGRLTGEEETFIPQMEHHKVVREARAWIAIYAAVIGSAIALGSWLPVMLIGLPTLYGGWLEYLFSISQHAGLADNVLDHRLNSRTIYVNPALRFIYWNMNYHVEHHMFPMVPYHALAALHAEVKHDLPTPYPSFIAAYREILPTLWRQVRQPDYYVKRELTASASPFRPELHRAAFDTQATSA